MIVIDLSQPVLALRSLKFDEVSNKPKLCQWFINILSAQIILRIPSLPFPAVGPVRISRYARSRKLEETIGAREICGELREQMGSGRILQH